VKAERIVVTGMGLLSALGLDVESSWQNIIAGTNPVRRFTLFDPTGLNVTFGMELPDGAEDCFKNLINPRRRQQMTRCTMIAVAASRQAVEDAGLDLSITEARRVGVVLGTTGTGYAPAQGEVADKHRILRNMASSAASWVGLLEKVRGPSFVVSTACSSGTYAIHAAHLLLQSGRCDAVICGAADSAISYLDVEGFQSLMALSEEADFSRASRPFDRTRNGFVIGEGGGVVVLERESTAVERGARMRAVCHLPGLSSDAYNIISPDPEGTSIAECMDQAVMNAGITPEQIDYINAHGTSTPLNDLVETKAIKQVFKAHAYQLNVSSTKSLTGHCLSGAAGVEAVLTIKAMEEGIVPPTANLKETESEMDLNYTAREPVKRDIRHALSNSFAFGGHNGSVVFSKV
jgi:3-oxoacyl-[acyl-carrier-protein] synthase II